LILADTSFLIDLVDGDRGAIDRSKELEDEPLYLSSISVHEYLFGVYYRFSENRSLLQRKLAMAENAFNAFKTLPMSKSIARMSAMIQASLVREGRQVDINDVYIGATAVYYGAYLLTRDKEHFARIKNLKVMTY